MNNVFGSAVVRSLFFLIIGFLLVLFSDPLPVWIVVMLGAMFVLPGAVSLVSYFAADTSDLAPSPLLPLVSSGSILFGLMLMIFPSNFIEFMLKALALLLMLGSAIQCHSLWSAGRRGARIGSFLYVFPVALFGVGLLVLFYWREAASLPFMVVGGACIVYSLVELWCALMVHREMKRRQKLEASEQVKEAEAQTPPSVPEAAEPTSEAGAGEVPAVSQPETLKSENDGSSVITF